MSRPVMEKILEVMFKSAPEVLEDFLKARRSLCSLSKPSEHLWREAVGMDNMAMVVVAPSAMLPGVTFTWGPSPVHYRE